MKVKDIQNLLTNSTVHKTAGLVGAALSAVLGPGVSSNAHLAFSAIAALYAAIVHGVDSAWNSPAGTPPA